MDRAFSPDAVKRGTIASRRGGFLPDLDQFDTQFFGISPREAVLLDPQQRLLLEVAYEAAEDAGIPLSKLSGSRTGVFVGLWNSDYERCILDLSNDLDFYATTGGGRYPASGRLAYFLDLRGPNLTVDTACSSSLVAIHLACASLRDGESEMALAGGVNVIMRPEITLSYSAAKMLSPEGRCKFGDAAADGYVRSEGAGIVFLKKLSRAVADGDSIYALIRGSAVNNDGRSSGSLIAPSREGQEDMLRTALRNAGVAPQEVAYIEAHGTGTLAGDPVEIAAISSVIANGLRTEPCMVGSVKTNFGHTESAAGIAGLIKVALSLQHGAIPASLHFREPNSRIDWSKNVVAIPTKATPWPARGAAPIGGVSGFGITGTNAHVVLQGSLTRVTKRDIRDGAHIFLLSAHTPEALEARARSWRDRLLADPQWPATLADLAYTSGARRTHHDHRLALVAGTRQELLDRINGWIAKQEQSGVRSGKRLVEENRRAVFVFPGQGGQWFGMGRTLLRDEPVFQKALAECDEAIRKFTGWSVTERLTQADAETALAGIDVIQPVLFAVMMSLAELWRSLGLDPQAVVGHSMGEAAAAAVCGALSLDDAAAVICHRSRLMKNASGRGLMCVAELSLAEAQKFVGDYGGRISVAANNSPISTVLSGDADAMEDALVKLEAREIFCRRIKVDVASHSAHMEPFRAELARLLKDIRPRQSMIPFYSTTSGVVENGAALDANYWSRNLRQPVLFSTAMQSLLADGFDTFIEVNSHPVLLQAMEDGIRHAQKDAVAVATLRRDKNERSEILDALGALYISGFPIDLERMHPQGTCLRLPAYPWQRERYWIDENDAFASRGQGTTAHPNLGAHIASSVQPGAHIWEINLRPASGSGDAAALHIELAMAAASEAFGPGAFSFEELVFLASSSKDLAGQLAIEPAGQGRWSLRISAKTDSGWSPRCAGFIRSGVEESKKWPAGEFRERAIEDHERDPLRECIQLAAERIEAREGAGPYRVSKISRIALRDIAQQGKRVARAALSGPAGSLQAGCRLELPGGMVLAEFAGLQFEPAAELDGLGCTYQLNWTATDTPTNSGANKKSWILFAESSPLTDRIVQKLKSAGDDCVSVAGVEELRRRLESSDAVCDGVIHLPRIAGTDFNKMIVREASEIVGVVHALANARRDTQPPRLWLLSTGALRMAGDYGEVAIAQAPGWGLGRVISAEHPEWRCANLDLSGSLSAEELDSLSAWLRADSPEEQIAIRGGATFVARLGRNNVASASIPLQLSPNATYLITGGLGGVGLNLARWMVVRGARSIALMGRRAPSESAQEAIKNLEFSGAKVRIFSADVADQSQTVAVLQAIAQEMPPLRGVFHLAAAMDSTLLADVNEEQIERAMSAKAEGAWALHRLTQNIPLDYFVLFSSMTAIIGQPGVATYAAANSALDALARYRHAKGLKAISIQWGPWADLGLTNTEKARRGVEMYAQQGIRALCFDETFDALSQLLQQDIAGALVAPIQWQKFARSFVGDSAPRTFLSLLPSDGGTADAAAAQATIRENLVAALPGRPRRALLESHLQEVLAGILKTSVSRLDPIKPLGSMGVDSLMALQFVRRLAVTTSVRLPATAVFNYPTLRVLAAELARRMEISLDAVVPAASVPQISENVAGISSDVADLTEEETIQALLQGGGAE
ncbi:MAG TPA: type I polyketide synthase [Candidatus Acidoferrales bacterium]|nr:type I polyketide synthase [Candidatus Acidoferrales bacterium]